MNCNNFSNDLDEVATLSKRLCKLSNISRRGARLVTSWGLTIWRVSVFDMIKKSAKFQEEFGDFNFVIGYKNGYLVLTDSPLLNKKTFQELDDLVTYIFCILRKFDALLRGKATP